MGQDYAPLGYGLPLAIGAKLADPEKFCMNFMGDLAFGHTGTEIETAVRAEAPITSVIVNNGTMGGYDRKLKVAMSKYGVGNQSGEYAEMSKALGATGIVVYAPGRDRTSTKVGTKRKQGRENYGGRDHHSTRH